MVHYSFLSKKIECINFGEDEDDIVVIDSKLYLCTNRKFLNYFKLKDRYIISQRVRVLRGYEEIVLHNQKYIEEIDKFLKIHEVDLKTQISDKCFCSCGNSSCSCNSDSHKPNKLTVRTRRWLESYKLKKSEKNDRENR